MYIRTKDGVYEIKEEINFAGEMFYYIKSKPPRKAFEECEIIKQSENLEELFDQIVYNGYLYQNKITWDGSLVEDSFEELEEPITDEMIKEGIYGAIWTDKGLIYVAKMNESGELELI